MNSLVEIIFRGLLSSIRPDFLKDLILKAKDLYFNSPAVSAVRTFEEVTQIINSHSYIDLVINTNELGIYEHNLPRVFINFGRNNDEVELIFFFDLKDLSEPTIKESLDLLQNWVSEFKSAYQFNYFICQIDNAAKDEYYFDTFGKGKLYGNIEVQ